MYVVMPVINAVKACSGKQTILALRGHMHGLNGQIKPYAVIKPAHPDYVCVYRPYKSCCCHSFTIGPYPYVPGSLLNVDMQVQYQLGLDMCVATTYWLRRCHDHQHDNTN